MAVWGETPTLLRERLLKETQMLSKKPLDCTGAEQEANMRYSSDSTHSGRGSVFLGKIGLRGREE